MNCARNKKGPLALEETINSGFSHVLETQSIMEMLFINPSKGSIEVTPQGALFAPSLYPESTDII
jgi:hypothetical protein